MRHLEALQGIADANDGNRGAGTSGYEASGAYVEQQLRAAGYSPQRQYFDFFYEEVHATSLTEVAPGSGPIENNPMSYSQGTGPGGVTGELASPAVNVQGCDAAAYGGANLTGKIALVSRGTCSFAIELLISADHGFPRWSRPGDRSGDRRHASDGPVPARQDGQRPSDGEVRPRQVDGDPPDLQHHRRDQDR